MLYLVPTQQTRQILEYALVLAASRCEEGLEVSGFCALSNHYHCVICDLLGGAKSLMPRFFADLNSLSARAVNVQLGRGGALWDQGSYDNVEHHGYQAALNQWVYVAGQAVAAGLVERPEHWPGLTWLPEDIGTTITVKRPDHAFFGTRPRRKATPDDIETLRSRAKAEDLKRRLEAEGDKKRGRTRKRRQQLSKERRRREEAKLNPTPHAPKSSTLPEEVSYTIPVPAFLRGTPVEEARKILRAALDAYVDQIHAERREAELGYLGREAVLAQDPMESAGDTWPVFDRNPRIASQGHALADRVALYEALIQWRVDHGEGVTVLRSAAPQRARLPAGSHRRAQELDRILTAYRAQAPPDSA